ncbi:sigma factor [Streptomyces sp. NPDC006875]|uniref:sigma factor n=1 Tax=Streptomyces sp. NPDC006875 TaxID=3154781 RepID=UPI003410B8F5
MGAQLVYEIATMNSPHPLQRRSIPSGSDPGTRILTPRDPRASDGLHAAAPDQDPLLVRFEREAMPFLSRLYAAATHLTHDRAHAEDVVQETYVRAFSAFGAFTGGTSLKLWLFHLPADTAALHAPGGRERSTRSRSSAECPCRWWTVERPPRLSAPQMPQSQALERLSVREVRTVLGRLPRRPAIVVHLADVEDFSPSQVAEILDIPHEIAAFRLFYGRHRLIRILTDAARRQGFLD